MKTCLFTVVTVLTFLLLSCQKEEMETTFFEPVNPLTICDKDDPLNQISWLRTLVEEGQDVTQKSFVQFIWIEEYNGEKVIVVDYGLTAGAFSAFNCAGKNVFVDDTTFYTSLSRENLLYEYQGYIDGYVVAKFSHIPKDSLHYETAWFILLKGSENYDAHWPADFYSFDIPRDSFIKFPFVPDFNMHSCGPAFFPNRPDTGFKINFRIQLPEESIIPPYDSFPCTGLEKPFEWEKFKHVELSEISWYE